MKKLACIIKFHADNALPCWDTYCLLGVCNAADCLNLSCNNKIDYIKTHKGKRCLSEKKLVWSWFAWHLA